MLRRTLPLAVCAVAAAAALGGPVGGAGAAPRACTADDLEGTRAPAMLRDHGLDTQDGPLVAGTRYRAIVVQELAIGDHARPVDGSISISAPNGPPLKQTKEDDRPAYDFTPTKRGTVTLTVSWEEEVGDPGSGDICAASQSFDLKVVEPTKPTLVGQFHRGAHSFESSFTLRLEGKRPQDKWKVTMLLRARRGTTNPPAPSGSVFARYTFKPDGFGGFVSKGPQRQLRHTFYAGLFARATLRIYPYGNIAFGRDVRFAFSIDVLQHGERLGGLRSGAVCRRIQFSGHSAVKCRAVGLTHRP